MLAARAEAVRCELVVRRPGDWRTRVLEESADGHAVIEYSLGDVRVIGKLRHDGLGEASLRLLQALEAAGTRTLRVPRPIAWLESPGALLMEVAMGEPCRSLDPMLMPATLERIGRALQELHALTIPLPMRSVRRLVDHVEDLVRPNPAVLAAALPVHAALIQRVLARLYAEESAWGPLPEVLLHRDFHLRQLFDDGTHVTVLDWDDAACGDPAFDVGYFATYLKTHYPVATATVGIAAFRMGYGGDVGLWERTATYERFNYLRRACRRFRIRDANWERELAAILERLGG